MSRARRSSGQRAKRRCSTTRRPPSPGLCTCSAATIPLEVIVNVEGWLKVRDAGGTVAWVEKKSVGDKHVLLVRGAVADILASPDAAAPVVFKAEQNVLLELVDPDFATATPGWAKVRHRDGQVGFVRIAQVWGL